MSEPLLTAGQSPRPRVEAEHLAETTRGALIEAGYPDLARQVCAVPEGGGSLDWWVLGKRIRIPFDDPIVWLTDAEERLIEKAASVAGVFS